MDAMARFQRDCTAFFQTLYPGGQSPLVFGAGLAKKPVLMLIGEAPGEQEALQGKPFVGKAGKNLEGFLEVLGLRRGEIYVTNTVKLRPTKISAAGRRVNRPPTREEKELFRPWLMKEIALVRPDALVTLGNVALQSFIRETAGHLHGQWTRAVRLSAGKRGVHPAPVSPVSPGLHHLQPPLAGGLRARPSGAPGIPACKIRRGE